MSVYIYKNCVIFKLWNYHIKDDIPEIKMHGTCILNIITNQFRLWNNPHTIKGEETPLSEVKEYSEKTRLHILDELHRLTRENCSERNVTGTFELTKGNFDYNFMIENYIGDINSKQVELKNRFEAQLLFYSDNSDRRIKKDIPYIDPYYMLRFKK